MPLKISRLLEDQVRQRASGLCEYCHTNERWQYVDFTIDHIISIHLGGTTTLTNLALACFHCNRLKGWKIEDIDPETGSIVALFNPRLNQWKEHFIWSADGSRLIGLSATGRATIHRLQMNRQRIIEIRQADIAIGRHPPLNDPILL